MKKTKRMIAITIVMALLLTVAIPLGIVPSKVEAVSNPGSNIFDIGEGWISIQLDVVNPGKLKVIYAGGSVKDNIDPLEQITIIGSTTSNDIWIGSNTTVNITLDNVNIDLSGITEPAIFITNSGTDVNLTLEGTNTLKSGSDWAGIGVDDNGASLTISGTGSLTVVGGTSSAGIGGKGGKDSGPITINSGTITATGGYGGAGIGGGPEGAGGIITINSGTITATGGHGGAGIGGGYGYTGGIIKISGGIITATGGKIGAGIGSGGSPFGTVVDAGTITISSGVDLSKINGGSADGPNTAGAKIGTGGSTSANATSYNLNTITYHSNANPNVTQALTYTVHGGNSDAKLPTLAHIQKHNAAFTTTVFDNNWYETATGGTVRAVGTNLTSTAIANLYAKAPEQSQEQPKDEVREKDDEQKLGVESYVVLATFVALISLGGITVLKFKK